MDEIQNVFDPGIKPPDPSLLQHQLALGLEVIQHVTGTIFMHETKAALIDVDPFTRYLLRHVPPMCTGKTRYSLNQTEAGDGPGDNPLGFLRGQRNQCLHVFSPTSSILQIHHGPEKNPHPRFHVLRFRPLLIAVADPSL